MIIMSICDKLQSYYQLDRSWIVSSIDAVKLLVKLKNTVMPSREEKRDEAAFVSKVSFYVNSRCRYLKILEAQVIIKEQLCLHD